MKVLVRGGKYFLPAPLVLDARDGGTQEYPVVYAAYPGEEPVLSGGRWVGGVARYDGKWVFWKPYKGKIEQRVVPEAQGATGSSVNCSTTAAQVRARTPNFEPGNPYAGGWAKMTGPAEPKSETAFKFDPRDLPRRWAKPAEAEVNCFFGANWGNDIIPIKSLDPRTGVITLAHGMTCNSQPLAILPYTSSREWLEDVQDCWLAFHRGQRYFVENVLEELDQPGEWCWDSQEGKLYFWPPDDALAAAEVVVPVLDGLISLRARRTLSSRASPSPRPTAATTSSARGPTESAPSIRCPAGNTAARPSICKGWKAAGSRATIS